MPLKLALPSLMPASSGYSGIFHPCNPSLLRHSSRALRVKLAKANVWRSTRLLAIHQGTLPSPQHLHTKKLTMQSNPPSEAENSSDLFRPSKRRRFYRKRTDAEDDTLPTVSSPPHPESMTVDELISHHGRLVDTPDQKIDEKSASVAEILRHRKAALRRKGGIEFNNSYTYTSATPQTTDALEVKGDDTPADIKLVIDRFAPQTGQVSAITDKHMYAFP